MRLKRLHDAIEPGVADLDDLALKERLVSLKAIRDQAQVDATRAIAMLWTSGSQAITLQMVQRFAGTARERIRIEGGGLAQQGRGAESVGEGRPMSRHPRYRCFGPGRFSKQVAGCAAISGRCVA